MIIPFDTHSTANLPSLVFLKKIAKVFSEKTSILPKKNPNLERFEKTCYFSCILRHICYKLLQTIFTFRNKLTIQKLTCTGINLFSYKLLNSIPSILNLVCSSVQKVLIISVYLYIQILFTPKPHTKFLISKSHKIVF